MGPLRRRRPGLLGYRSGRNGVMEWWDEFQNSMTPVLHHSGCSEIGRAPRCCPGHLLVPSEAGSLAPTRAKKMHTEIGGLCGLCSRDFSLDERALFVAELTGHKMNGNGAASG